MSQTKIPFSFQATDPEPAGLSEVLPWPYARINTQCIITYSNSQFGRLINRLSAETKGHNINDFFTNDINDLPITAQLRTLTPEKAWHGYWIIKINDRSPSVEIMLRIDPKDTNIIWVIVMENPIINDEVVLSKNTEFRLLQVLLDNTLDFLYLIDTTGHFIITNLAFQKAIQVPYPSFEIGKRLGDFVSDETQRQFSATDKRVLEQQKPLVNHISYFRLKNGDGLWVQTTKVPVFDSHGHCICLACVSRDISELKDTTKRMRQAMRKAEIANRTKEDFLANMSHEIRTPINGIVGMTELCLDTELNEEQRECLDSVINCTQTLLRVVNDILDFSKMEGGYLNLEYIDFHLGECCQEIVSQLTTTADSKSLHLRLNINERVNPEMNGDPIRIRQVLYNLINNALKFTEKGEITVSLEPTGRQYPETNVRIIVSDTGIGIPKKRLEDIFNSFTQADSSTTRKYGGTGLGLAICRKIVEIMGGSIDVESTEGKGSTFIVEIPIQEANSPDLTVSKQYKYKPTLPPEATRKLSILVVEDNPISQQIIVRRLQKMGHAVTLMPSPEEALINLKNTPYELIFADYEFSDMNGPEFTRCVRKNEKIYSLVRTPIVATTAHTHGDKRRECEEAGMDAYITKPFSSATLQSILDIVIEKQPLRGVGFRTQTKEKTFSFSRFMNHISSDEQTDMLEAASLYLEHYRNDLSTLENAIINGDPREIGSWIHQIKRGVGSLGDLECETIASEIEQLLVSSDPVKLMPLFEGLEARMEALAQEIRWWLESNARNSNTAQVSENESS